MREVHDPVRVAHPWSIGRRATQAWRDVELFRFFEARPESLVGPLAGRVARAPPLVVVCGLGKGRVRVVGARVPEGAQWWYTDALIKLVVVLCEQCNT